MLEFLEQHCLISGGDTRTRIADRQIKSAVTRVGPDDHFAGQERTS